MVPVSTTVLPVSVWRGISITVLFCASLAGYVTPKLLVYVGMSQNGFSILKGFSAGVILGVALLHLLNEGIVVLSEFYEYPVGLALAGVGVFISFMLGHTGKGHKVGDNKIVPGTELRQEISNENSTIINIENKSSYMSIEQRHANSNEGSTLIEIENSSSNVSFSASKKIVALEFTVALHSIIIGYDLGSKTDSFNIEVLTVALIFHQFFEGNALGAYCEELKFSTYSSAFFGLIFSLSLPVGILIGWLTGVNTPSGVVVQGCANCVASGMLLYIALVELMHSDFSEDHVRDNIGVKCAMIFAACLGYSTFAYIAIYA